MFCIPMRDAVVQEGAAVLELLAGKSEPLPAGWDAVLRLNIDAHIFDQAVALHLERERLAGVPFHKDLHVIRSAIYVTVRAARFLRS